MLPLWFDMNARVWLHAQHVLLDNVVAMMRMVSGARCLAPVRLADRCDGCGGALQWRGPQAAPYQRCPACGLIRFHAPLPQLPAGSAVSGDTHRVLSFRPRPGA